MRSRFNILPGLLGVLFTLLQATSGMAAKQSLDNFNVTELEGYYVINLESALLPFAQEYVQYQDIFSRYPLYTTTFEKNGKTWNRLRLGFFPSKDIAQNIQQTYLDVYKQSWIAKASVEEKAFSTQTLLFPDKFIGVPVTAKTLVKTPEQTPDIQPAQATPKPDTVLPQAADQTLKLAIAPTSIPATTPVTQTEAAPTLSEQRLGELMEQGRQAMAGQDYSRAVQIYTRVLETPSHPYLQDAQEYLGLARERKGQIAHAKAEYEKYLELYPKGARLKSVRRFGSIE